MKAPSKPKWALTPEQKTELRALLADIDVEGPETAPAFVRLLEYWEGCRAPWDVVVPCYRCKGGVWLVESVAAVVAAIRRHVEDGN